MLDVYKVQIDDINLGIDGIALVKFPAVEKDWLCFNKDNERLSFSVINEEKHELLGVIARCDYPIFRNFDGYKCFIVFDKETIELMTEKWLRDGNFNSINTEHTKNYVDGVFLKEVFIKNIENGINPQGFEDISNYSLFAKYKVENDEIWEQVKNGTYNGFSLEGMFNLKEEINTVTEEDELFEEILNKINNILKQ